MGLPRLPYMNRRSLLLSAGAATLAACASTTPARSRDFALASDIDAAVARGMAQLGLVPGLSVAVYTREGAYARGFGVADIDTGERADADTAFYIASSTKPLTALALAALDGRGELDLDSTLAGYAPDAPFPESVRAGDVRLRDMLAHTSGIDNAPLGFRVAFTGQHDPETLWRLLSASTPNEDAPLGTFDYTNVGYNIATVLTDRRQGIAWQDLLQREVFSPAGMTRSSARMSLATANGWRVAKPHGMDADGRMQRIYLEKTDQTMQSAGGVIMSANDALRWLELMIEDGRVGGRQVAPAAAIRSTRAPIASVNASFGEYAREHYGLGWYAGRYRDEPMVHHFGGFAGFRAHVSYLPERGVGVAAFVNDDTASFTLVDAIASYVYDLTGGRDDAATRYDEALAGLVRRRDEGIQRSQADRANRAGREWQLTRPKPAYAGAYENPEWGRVEIAATETELAMRYGVLHAVAEPFTRPDSIRVELVPGMGIPVLFTGEGPAPDALLFRNQRFARV